MLLVALGTIHCNLLQASTTLALPTTLGRATGGSPGIVYQEHDNVSHELI
jgi:hypothetical protein